MPNKLIAVGEYPQYVNKNKQDKLLILFKEYRKTASKIAKYQASYLKDTNMLMISGYPFLKAELIILQTGSEK